MSSSKPGPRILLVRPDYGTRLADVARIVTEPLDLEYLAATAVQENCEYRIHDPVVARACFEDVLAEFRPDIVGISGYYPAKDKMIRYARRAKAHDSRVLTITGGVHAELNCSVFYDNAVDLVVHSGGTDTFQRILQAIKAGGVLCGIPGTCFRKEDNSWVSASKVLFDPARLPIPDRAHFNEHKAKFSYLRYGPTALVKSAYGCPFKCRFCYCRLLNNGRYSARDLEDVVAEIKGIECDRIWIVDDTFLLEMDRVRRFVELLEREAIRKEFIIYSRSQFIAGHPEVVPLLKKAGVIDVIIGFEAINREKLASYNKSISEQESRRCIELLKAASIECTGLFIMDADSSVSDFAALDRWIGSAGLTTYTLSIFSPYPGTESFDEYRSRLTTTDCRKWDLLHLVMDPSGMSRFTFYLLVFYMHLKVLFRNRAMRNYVLSFSWLRTKAMP